MLRKMGGDFLRKDYFYMLTPRLDCILRHTYGNIAADIGTDHAYIPIELIKTGRAKRVIACDINTGPVRIAAANIEKHGLSDKIQTAVGPGLSPPAVDSADTIIIAGMGGKLIRDILADDLKKAQKADLLVLQPMNSQSDLRHFLFDNGFCIISEDMAAEDNKVYNIISARTGAGNEYGTELDYHIPPCLYNHELFGMLYRKKEREFTKIINGLEKADKNNPALNEKLDLYNKLLNDLRNLRKGNLNYESK